MECALSADGETTSCLTDKHVATLAEYAKGNTYSDLKNETKCNNDSCILEKGNAPQEVKDVIIREAFKAPAKRMDGDYWLNNTEIDTVISQLRCKNPGFTHGFIHMVDLVAFPPSNVQTFDYKVYDVNEIDFPREFRKSLIDRNIIPGDNNDESHFVSKLSTYDGSPMKSYGIVCNTDSSKGTGQHWFALYISTDQKDSWDPKKPIIKIELFNSAGGGSDNKTFDTFWTKKAIEIAKCTSVRCVFEVVTSIQHQSPETGNCGSYSLFYIWARLQGIMPSEFNNPHRLVLDTHMEKFRQQCFQQAK